MADFGGGGVLGGLGAIFGGLVGAVRAFAGITARDIIKFLSFVRDHLLELTRALYEGLKELAKSLARNVVALARVLRHGVATFFNWARRSIEALHQFLKTKLGPILRFLDTLRRRIDEIYKKWVRPVLDTIDFIRSVNRVLNIFHIDVLRQLDATLSEIERRIEAPFDWARQQITRIDNWLDRIIGLDGLYQKFTLIASLRAHSPAWMRYFWEDQVAPKRVRPGDPTSADTYAERAPARDVDELGALLESRDSERSGIVAELSAQTMLVARGLALPATEPIDV